MARWDELGLLWRDEKIEKIAAVKVKREPPDPVWLRDDYLPNLERARAHKFDTMTDAEILEAWQRKDRLVWDTEFYPNYALLGFRSLTTGKLIMFEKRRGGSIDVAKFKWILQNFVVSGFNDTCFDVPMAWAVCAGFDTDRLQKCVNDLIFGGDGGFGMRPQELKRAHKLEAFHVNNIDLLQLTPLAPSLKVCAGRLHAPLMQDLPFPPGKELTDDQITILRWYWTNDLANTALLYETHKTAIELREILTAEYGVDVRSKSDPQIAEAVIRKEIQRITGQKYLAKAEIIPGRTFRYVPPSYLKYSTPTMQWVLEFVRQQDFVIGPQGEPLMPKGLEKLVIEIAASKYKMGMGGLHSQEKSVVHVADDEWELTDNDVTSYYPALIIQQGMYPPNIGPVFLDVFKRIVDRRVAAKRAGDKATAETLKIVANGTFGKTGERGGHSVVYYPEMMIQVTLSGQLALLLLIEQLELNGIHVISANTDGIMIKCRRRDAELKANIIKWWEHATGLGMETSIYKAVYSRDINNYIALYEKPKDEPDAFRFAKAIGAYRKTLGVYPLKWNPTCEIASEAVIAYLATGTPIEQTIDACCDIRKFLEVRLVRGGACKNGEYLGKAIRWYYARGEEGEIVNAKNGHMVPRSQGARPCMTLPDAFPDDVDLERYHTLAYAILEDLSPTEAAEEAEKPIEKAAA